MGFGSEEGRLRELDHGNVSGVVDGEVGSKLPTAGQQGGVGHPLDAKCPQISDGEVGAVLVEVAGGVHPSPRRGHLEVDQVRRGQALTPETAPSLVTVGAVIGQRGDDDAGVDDDHRVSRSMRTARPAPSPASRCSGVGWMGNRWGS